MLATVSDEGTRAEIRLAEMIVTSEFVDESTQPWGGASCFRYRVSISAASPIIGQGQYVTHGYGSQHDYDNGDNNRAEEIAWMVLDELLSASYDPDEFLELCLSEPDLVTLEGVRGVLAVIEYAERIGRVLELNASDIREGVDA